MKRNIKGIKIWMIMNSVREKDIVAATGCKQAYVNRTLNGQKNCREALFHLEELGCPTEFLGLPGRRA